ncbi:hypothetical protein DSM19430T_06790 [Desulfovibrio psychrotolerans]|uniref:Uncharacterized protein n=1 Tax=Desulfovibrio psychrotolerans TaxID=415242 RepID=A0A7J0BS65_9BACT|nr:hypothetical protein DSM19430T_06790 [Desulfovibrio psychrotolerans]
MEAGFYHAAGLLPIRDGWAGEFWDFLNEAGACDEEEHTRPAIFHNPDGTEEYACVCRVRRVVDSFLGFVSGLFY